MTLWFDYEHDIKKNLLLMVRRAQKPITLTTALGLSTLSHVGFTTVRNLVEMSTFVSERFLGTSVVVFLLHDADKYVLEWIDGW